MVFIKKLSQYPPFETLDNLLNKLSSNGIVNTISERTKIIDFLFDFNKNKIKIAMGTAETNDNKNKIVEAVTKYKKYLFLISLF